MNQSDSLFTTFFCLLMKGWNCFIQNFQPHTCHLKDASEIPTVNNVFLILEQQKRMGFHIGTSISTPANLVFGIIFNGQKSIQTTDDSHGSVSQGELDRSFKAGFGGYRMRCQPVIFKTHSQTNNACMVYIYLHENHKKSTNSCR